jgi:cytosine/adenosine deaminase-related metal-dependent hydrolase
MILLKNCLYILTPDGKPDLQGADLLIRGNRIARIADSIDPGTAADTGDGEAVSESGSRAANGTGGVDSRAHGLEIIDCSRHIVVPGLVNTHHHFYQTLTRNLRAVQNAKLFQWLVYLYEVWKNIDADAVYYSTLVAVGELLKTGCTCTTDHHYLYPRDFQGDLMGIQFDAAHRLGIRFSPCRGSMSLSKKDGGLPPDTVVQPADEILRDSRRTIESYHDDSGDSMGKIVLAPCSPFSVTEDLMRETALLARSYGVRLHTHLAETADEDEYCMRTYGRRPLRLMFDLDFVGSDVSFAHGIFFDDGELKQLAETGTSIAHCPSSNMRLGSGIARVKEMLELDVNVALAVDGSASNDTSDMVGEMRAALMLQRVRYGADALTGADVYRMATENGARLLGFDGIGRVEEGGLADLALFDMSGIEYAGSLSDPPAALVFAGSSHRTAFTIVNGRIVVRDGRLVGLDEAEIVARANEIAARLLPS